MEEAQTVHGVHVRVVSEVNDPAYDGLVVVTGAGGALPQALEDFILAAQELDKGLDSVSFCVPEVIYIIFSIYLT